MRVCFLSAAHPALDKRVFDKEARALADAGFEVIHLCPQQPGEPLGRWEKDGIVLDTYARGGGLKARARQLFNLYRRARDLKADVYHCNEVDSWVVGTMLRLTTGRRCIFDVHEHYPSTFAEAYFPAPVRPAIAAGIRALYLFLTPLTWKVVLAKRSVAGDFWFARKKLALVQNFTPLSALKTDAGEAAHQPGPPVLVHLGLISKLRGWPQLLDAMARQRHKDAVLHVIGTFNDGTEQEFFARAAELGLTERIRFDRWMPFDQAFQCLQAADIGLILFLPGIQNHVYALPHKMFDYMLAGLPVVAPEFALEVADIVRESECGVLLDPTRPELIAKTIDALLNNRQERMAMGEHGRQAVIAHYNWEQEAAKLIALYREAQAAA